MKIHAIKSYGQDAYGAFRLSYCGIPIHARSPIPTETVTRDVTCVTCLKNRAIAPSTPDYGNQGPNEWSTHA